MHTVEPKVYLIGKSEFSNEGIYEWLHSLGATDFTPKREFGPGAGLISMAAKRCFDNKTEILTQHGWVLFSDLKKNESVLTLNPLTEEIEWQIPYGYYSDYYEGEMVSAKGRDISINVTPDHRVYGQFDSTLDIPDNFYTAENLFKTKTPFRVPMAKGDWVGEIPKYPDDKFFSWAKLIAYYVTEGSINSLHGEIKNIVIYGDHLEAIETICKDLDLPCSYTIDPRNNCKKIRVGGGHILARRMIEWCGHISDQKKFPNWVLNLPKEYLKEIWDILVKTDGTIRPNNTGWYLSTSAQLCGQAQEILLKIGYASSIHEAVGNKKPIWRVAQKTRSDVMINNMKSDPEAIWEKTQYKGMIHCVATRNGVVFVRRDSSCYWSGNCYMSFQPFMNPNIKKVREDMEVYLDNILSSGHGSVLEHVVYNFTLENVSRVFTAEMNRHRAGVSISEGSLRYIRFDDIAYWIPESIRDQEGDDADIINKKTMTRSIFNQVFKFVEQKYEQLEGIWDINNLPDFHSKKLLTSMFRRIVPMGVATGGIWSSNIRALRHIFTMRCDPAAEEEIRIVCAKMLQIMIKEEPLLFKDFYFDEDEKAWKCKWRKV
jgi:thymidylate synthase (FAD)